MNPFYIGVTIVAFAVLIVAIFVIRKYKEMRDEYDSPQIYK